MKRKFKLLAILLVMLFVITACNKPGNNKADNGVKTNGGNNTAANEAREDIGGYPEKPVEVVVGFGAGGETDTVARLVFQYASEHFGQNFAIINRPGASGEIAWAEVAKAKPDGYTIAFINPPTFVSHPLQRDDCTYKVEDFEIISNMVKDPACIVVPKDSEINSMKDYVEKSKGTPISIGYSGPGTSEALTLRELEDEYDAKFEKIPYDGSASSIVALLGGKIDSCILNVSGAINYTNDGSIKVIGVASTERAPEYPDVKTFEEDGIKVYNDAYRGIAAPKGTPKAIIEKIDEAVKLALEDPDFQKRAKEMSVPIRYLNAEEFTKVLDGLTADLKEEIAKGEW